MSFDDLQRFDSKMADLYMSEMNKLDTKHILDNESDTNQTHHHNIDLKSLIGHDGSS